MGTEIKIPEDVSREAMALTERLLGPLADVADFLGDKVRFYRWQSALKTLDKASEILKAKGVEPKEVPVKFLVPFLEKCSLEEPESELQDAWAHLLAAASEEYDSIYLAYVDVLSQLGPDEARYLNELAENTTKQKVGTYFESMEMEVINELFGLPFNELKTYLDEQTNMDNDGRRFTSIGAHSTNALDDPTRLLVSASEHVYLLERLGLIQIFVHSETASNRIDKDWINFAMWVRITIFGYNFVMCSRGKPGIYRHFARSQKAKDS